MNAEKSMTIGILTDDGKTISSHFGRALYVEVITLTDLHTIDEALLALGSGTLVHSPERIHHKGNRA
ncbi:MAG: hypothetical protein WBG80_14560 [Bacteroidota bacterium]